MIGTCCQRLNALLACCAGYNDLKKTIEQLAKYPQWTKLQVRSFVAREARLDAHPLMPPLHHSARYRGRGP